MKREPAAHRFRVKHSTTEPPGSLQLYTFFIGLMEEHRGSVVEFLNLDRRVASPEPHNIVSMSETHYPLLSTGSTREDPFQSDWEVKNKNKQTSHRVNSILAWDGSTVIATKNLSPLRLCLSWQTVQTLIKCRVLWPLFVKVSF